MIGGANAAAIPLAGLTAGLIMIYILVRVSIRTVQGEIWIRRMGMGDLEYRVEPTGNDEITKALEALETLRQSSLRAIQLDRVQELSDELQQKDQALETTLEELRRTQDRIISQQKLAELGELAAGVAHEIRNPLQFVRNFATSSGMLINDLEALLEQPDGFDREEARDIMRDILDNMERMTHHSDRANGIVSGMMTLDRGTGGGFRPVDLNRLVDQQTNVAHGAVQAQEPGFSAHTTIAADPEPGGGHADPGGHSKSDRQPGYQRLPGNGRESEGNRGTYTPELMVSTLGTPESVTITVRDNGPGMTPEVMNKMFNPFFTTRNTGHNTGLGLSLAHDIAREHGGDIHVESELGEYAEIRVLLPVGPAPERPGNGTEPTDTGY